MRWHQVRKIIGGVYDNRFLVKPVSAAKKLMPNAVSECPYEGAKEMIPVTDIDDKGFLLKLITAMYEELPEIKCKNRK